MLLNHLLFDCGADLEDQVGQYSILTGESVTLFILNSTFSTLLALLPRSLVSRCLKKHDSHMLGLHTLTVVLKRVAGERPS